MTTPPPDPALHEAHRLLDYDLWASRQILDALTALPTLAADDPPARLFSHLLTALEIWLMRLEGRPLPTQDFWPVLPPADWAAGLAEAHARWRAFLADADLATRYAYRNSRGIPHTSTLRDVVTHLAIHGQHHRAQIAVHLRAQGHTPPLTDFIYFTRQAEAAA